MTRRQRRLVVGALPVVSMLVLTAPWAAAHQAHRAARSLSDRAGARGGGLLLIARRRYAPWIGLAAMAPVSVAAYPGGIVAHGE